MWDPEEDPEPVDHRGVRGRVFDEIDEGIATEYTENDLDIVSDFRKRYRLDNVPVDVGE